MRRLPASLSQQRWRAYSATRVSMVTSSLVEGRMIGVSSINSVSAMKTFAKSILAIAAAALAFASCQKVETSDSTISTKTVGFVANSIDTKTAFGTPDGSNYPVLWTENDSQVSVILNSATSGAAADLNVASDYKSATFQFEIPEPKEGQTPPESYTFKVVSPAKALVGNSATKGMNLNVPVSQTPTAASVDEAAQILYATTDTYTELPEEPIELSFNHFTAYGKISIKNLDAAAKISGIEMIAESNWAGKYYYNTTDGTMQENSASNSITINTTSADNNWFACAPVDLGGKKITINVNTDKGVYSKVITIPAGKKFESGVIAKFGVDFSGIAPQADDIYTLVTDYSELTVDSKVIIAAATANKALGTQGNNNCTAVEITKTDNTIVNPASAVRVFTLSAGNEENTLAFKDAAGYIYAASSSSNYLRTETNLSGNSSWSLVLNDGIATLKAMGSSTRNWLRYNSTSTCFSCYASGQGDVCLYKLDGSGTTTTIVTEPDPEPQYIFDNLEDLCAADLVSGTEVTVTLFDEPITRFYQSTSNPGQNNGVYLMVGTQEIEIYKSGVPSNWEVGGTLSGTVTCPWEEYNGIWELCPSGWNVFTYKAPATGDEKTVTFGPDWNTLFGTSYEGSVTGIVANEFTLTGTVDGVTFTANNGTSRNGYVKTSDFRFYNGYTLTFTAPTGKKIINISAGKGGKTISGLAPDSGTISIESDGSAMEWSGEAASVTFTASATAGFASANVTYR